MSDILTLYASGASLSQTAKALGISKKTAQRKVQAAGMMRTKSEGKIVQYNPITSRPGDALVLKLSWVTIRSPYVVRPWYPGTR